MRSSRLACALLAVSMTLSLASCSKKKAPVTPASATPMTTAVAAPTATPQPVPADAVASPLDGELLEANRHAYQNGLLGDVYFDFDLATLRGDARDRLARNAEFLRSRPEFQVQVEGHCDERGTNDYNLALGERRAQAARDYLTSLGVGAERLRTVSYGEEQPACSASAESCWQLNRRAHFVLVGRVPRG